MKRVGAHSGTRLLFSHAARTSDHLKTRLDDLVGAESCEGLSQVVGQLLHELERLQVVGARHVVHALDADGEVLGHESGLDRIHAHLLQRLREPGQLGVVVQGGAVQQATRPREDGGDGVRGGLLALRESSLVVDPQLQALLRWAVVVVMLTYLPAGAADNAA